MLTILEKTEKSYVTSCFKPNKTHATIHKKLKNNDENFKSSFKEKLQ